GVLRPHSHRPAGREPARRDGGWRLRTQRGSRRGGDIRSAVDEPDSTRRPANTSPPPPANPCEVPGSEPTRYARRSDRPKHRQSWLRASVPSDRRAQAWIPPPTTRTSGRAIQGTDSFGPRLGLVRAKTRTDA